MTPSDAALIAAGNAWVRTISLGYGTPAGLAAMRAALASPQPAPTMPEWHPIETAPKDGTEFLAFKTGPALGKCICVCTWLDEDHPDYDGETPHVAWDHSGFWDATHWMPLPAAPQEPQR